MIPLLFFTTMLWLWLIFSTLPSPSVAPNAYTASQLAPERPVVDCFVDRMKLTVEMLRGIPSELFVKGRHHDGNQNCVVKNNNMITILHGQCGLQPERSLNPPGLFFRTCIVVKLHPFFVTMVDKTYCISCFYMESVKQVDPVVVGVSMLPTTEVGVSFPMPVCSHSIRRGSPTGPIIRYATVGEPIFHVWSCPSDQYGMLVQNCFVSDDEGTRIQIINDKGCGIDRYIIETPLYNQDLTMAYRESCVFKFADKPITRFNCQIKVCIKPGGGCDGVSPPDCRAFDSFNPNGNRPFPIAAPPRTNNGFAPGFNNPDQPVSGFNATQNNPNNWFNMHGDQNVVGNSAQEGYSREKRDTIHKNGPELSEIDDFDYMDVISEPLTVLEPLDEDGLQTNLIDELAKDFGAVSSVNAVCVPNGMCALILILLPIAFCSHAAYTISLWLKLRYTKAKETTVISH